MKRKEKKTKTERPAGFFDEVVGGWYGEPLVRPPQPVIDSREDLDWQSLAADAFEFWNNRADAAYN